MNKKPIKQEMANQELDGIEFVVPEVRRVRCTIRGTRPLLMNKYSGHKERQDLSPKEEATQKLYVVDEKLVEPAEHIEKAMERTASGVNYEGKKSYKDLVKAFVTVEPMYIVHKHQAWDIDTRAVRIPATKGRIPCHRPILAKWELSFEIVIKNKRMELKKIEIILRKAGEFNGIGDYRPKFGLFEVTQFELIET